MKTRLFSVLNSSVQKNNINKKVKNKRKYKCYLSKRL